VEAGFGAPRETMQLVTSSGGRIALMTTGTARDVTDMMRRYTDRRIDELARAGLDGYVFKADSPSCGIEADPVFAVPVSAVFNLESTGRALFAEALMCGCRICRSPTNGVWPIPRSGRRSSRASSPTTARVR
jgi:uncharacterized protein YbbK (DUF523 family)